jgi:hypothetical protein
MDMFGDPSLDDEEVIGNRDFRDGDRIGDLGS